MHEKDARGGGRAEEGVTGTDACRWETIHRGLPVGQLGQVWQAPPWSGWRLDLRGSHLHLSRFFLSSFTFLNVRRMLPPFSPLLWSLLLNSLGRPLSGPSRQTMSSSPFSL